MAVYTRRWGSAWTKRDSQTTELRRQIDSGCVDFYIILSLNLNWGKLQQNITALAVFLEFWKCTSMHNHLPVRYLCDLYNSTLKNILLWKHSPSCKLPPITPMLSLHSQELLRHYLNSLVGWTAYMESEYWLCRYEHWG